MGCRARREERYEALDTLIGSLVVVVLGTLDDVKQSIAVVRDTLQGSRDAVLLPRIFQRQNTEKQVQMRSQLVSVSEGNLNKENRFGKQNLYDKQNVCDSALPATRFQRAQRKKSGCFPNNSNVVNVTFPRCHWHLPVAF